MHCCNPLLIMTKDYEDYFNSIGITEIQEQETILNFLTSVVSIALERDNNMINSYIYE